MSNQMNHLHAIGLNPFAVTLLAESMLRSEYVKHCGVKPLTFNFPVHRSDCPGWIGVRITIEAVSAEDATPARPSEAREPLSDFEVSEMFQKWNNTPGASYASLIRTVEEHHGIIPARVDSEGAKP